MSLLKRILLSILLLLVAGGIGYLLYFLIFREVPQKPTEKIPTTPSISTLPTAKEGAPPAATSPLPKEGQLPTVSDIAKGGRTKVTTLTEDPIQTPQLEKDGKTVNFYNKNDGKFYRRNVDGSFTPLSDAAFFNAQTITWSANANQAIIEYPDGSNIQYDFVQKKQVTLPKHWKDFDYSPQSNEIVAKSIGIAPENRWLVEANPDGSAARAIAALGENEAKVIVDWSPNNQIVALSKTADPIGFGRQEIYFVGRNNENFKSMLVEGLGIVPEWSPSGKNLLYSVFGPNSDYKPELWIVNAQGDTIGANRKNLKIQTWADKCTFASEKTVYCAVPTFLREGIGFEPESAFGTNDLFYKIDLTTGLKTLLASPDLSVTAESLMINKDESTLYFTDKITNQLYSVKLK